MKSLATKKEMVVTGPSSIYNVLSSGTVLTGNLVTGDDIRIDGTIEGNIISSGKIVVGNTGVVTGDVECHNIELFGTVNGNIQCSEIVVLRQASHFTGDIKTQVIEIEPGAAFFGNCRMNDGIASAPRPAAQISPAEIDLE